MEILFTNKLNVLLSIAIFLIRISYAIAIYYKTNCISKKTRNILTFLSFPFPIITGIICAFKYKKSTKDSILILIMLALSLALTISGTYTYNQSEKFYDKDATEQVDYYDRTFIDEKGNRYSFDFDKSGYDKLYINNTNEYLYAELCYINSEGYLHYDEDMSITAKDETSCVDKDGSIYYPAKYTAFNSDGSIEYSFNSANFNYDRFGKAYTYDYVPYYDEDGNKYAYSFDSDSLKGYYTNVETKETFDNEYSFVDENGYFVYDSEHSFVKNDDVDNVEKYIDLLGNTYYWASGISWNEEGNLLDSDGTIIKEYL